MNNYPTLQLNDTGDAVKILQQLLKILGFYPASITGSFDTTTEEAVKSFQRENNLKVNGIVNKENWDLLIEQTETRTRQLDSNLMPFNEDIDISTIQRKLRETLYYDGEITGNYDEETIEAVKTFQLNNDILANGVLNPKTINTLNETYSSLVDCTLIDNEIEGLETYIVKKGDTLYSIAKNFNTTVNELKRINNLQSDTVVVGASLLVPKKENTGSTTYYTVKKGDTLYSISKAYNVSVDSIKNANNLTSNTLTVGQQLIIPNPTTDYENYTVKRGDTLYSIAKNAGISVNEIMNLNNLSSSVLTIGQVLIIPKQPNSDNTANSYQTYTVQKGDTLYSISRKFNISVDKIKSANNLTSDTLSIGQQLKIPNA